MRLVFEDNWVSSWEPFGEEDALEALEDFERDGAQSTGDEYVLSLLGAEAALRVVLDGHGLLVQEADQVLVDLKADEGQLGGAIAGHVGPESQDEPPGEV